MSIATALTALNTDITNARNKIVDMGGTATPNGGTYQLADDIATIPAGAGGAYDIQSTDNDDGSQNLDITDSSGGGGHSHFQHGTFTLISATRDVSIPAEQKFEHIVIWKSETESLGSNYIDIIFVSPMWASGATDNITVRARNTGTIGYGTNNYATRYKYEFSDSYIRIYAVEAYDLTFIPNVQYNYIAWKEELA